MVEFAHDVHVGKGPFEFAAACWAIYPPRPASSKSSDVERFRYASICAFRSATFCSAVAIASAPAIKRRGGGSWLAMVMSARASFAGSPDCLPFWAFQNSSCFALRSS